MTLLLPPSSRRSSSSFLFFLFLVAATTAELLALLRSSVLPGHQHQWRVEAKTREEEGPPDQSSLKPDEASTTNRARGIASLIVPPRSRPLPPSTQHEGLVNVSSLSSDHESPLGARRSSIERDASDVSSSLAPTVPDIDPATSGRPSASSSSRVFFSQQSRSASPAHPEEHAGITERSSSASSSVGPEDQQRDRRSSSNDQSAAPTTDSAPANAGLRLTEEEWKEAFAPEAPPPLRRRARMGLPPAPSPENVKPEVRRIADNPPQNFFELKRLVPFGFYLPDRTGQFVAIIEGGKLDLSALRFYSAEDIMYFIKFLGCLYFAKMDGRRDARMKIILDLGGLNVTSFVWNGGIATLKAILSGLKDLQPLLGETTSDFVIVNSSPMMKVIIQPTQLLLPSFVRLHVKRGPEDYAPFLRRLIGRPSLPRQYGGASSLPIDETPMSVAMAAEVEGMLQSSRPRWRGKM